MLLRALEERKQVKGQAGRLAMGWLIVEDLAMVLALVLLSELAQAVRRGEIVVEFQPRVGLEEGELRGFEALARWE